MARPAGPTSLRARTTRRTRRTATASQATQTCVAPVMVATTRRVVQDAHLGLDRLGEIDPVSQDLVIGILESLEKHLWMLQAQLS